MAHISKLDYLEGQQGRTHLKPLEGLPIFYDDLYVDGHLPTEEVVSVGNRLHSTSVENGTAKRIVSRTDFQPCARNTWRRLQNHQAECCTPFQQTARVVESSTLCPLSKPNQIAQQKKQWETLLPEKKIWGLFCCEGQYHKGGDGKTAIGSSNTGKIAGGQGRRHLPNRFHPRVSGHVRPKALVEHFAQVERFCFPGFWVPRPSIVNAVRPFFTISQF